MSTSVPLTSISWHYISFFNQLIPIYLAVPTKMECGRAEYRGLWVPVNEQSSSLGAKAGSSHTPQGPAWSLSNSFWLREAMQQFAFERKASYSYSKKNELWRYPQWQCACVACTRQGSDLSNYKTTLNHTNNRRPKLEPGQPQNSKHSWCPSP